MSDRRRSVGYLDQVARMSGSEIALLRTLPALLDRVPPLVVLAEDVPPTELLTQPSGVRPTAR